MSDLEDDMLSFHKRIKEISVAGFKSSKPNSKMLSINNLHNNLNHFDKEPSSMLLSSDFVPQRNNFNKYQSSHRSVLNCRTGSPSHSLHSGASVSSVFDIVNLIKCESLNMNELQTIKVMVCNKLKHQLREKYGKRRNKSIMQKTKNYKVNSRRKLSSSRESSDSAKSSDNEDEQQSMKTNLRKPLSTSFKSKAIPHSEVTMAIQKNSDHYVVVMKPDSTQECNKGRTCETSTKAYPVLLKKIKDTINTGQKMKSNQSHVLIEEQESHSSENEDIFLSHYKQKQDLNVQSSNSVKSIKCLSLKSNVKDVETESFKKPLAPKTKGKKNVNKGIISKSTLSPVCGSNEKDVGKKDVSNVNEILMKSSFSKRKLFTQKVDLLSVKVSSDSAGASPKSDVNNKEKNKARKLVTTQSCLNRSVSDEDNFLDLIHKIVPTQHTDLTSKIVEASPACNKKINSKDTDILVDKTVNTISEKNSKMRNLLKGDDRGYLFRDCSIVLHDVGFKNTPRNGFQKSKCVKSFWDTDIESEKESGTPLPKKTYLSETKGQLKLTPSTLNTTKHQESKIGNVFTVQDFINKRNSKKKTLNNEIKVLKVNEKTKESINKTSSSVQHPGNKENILEPVTTDRKITSNKSRAVKENLSKNKQTANSGQNSNITRKTSRRSKSSRNCSGCDNMITKSLKSDRKDVKTKKSNVNTKKNKRALRTTLNQNCSLSSNNSLNISSRTRSRIQTMKGKC